MENSSCRKVNNRKRRDCTDGSRKKQLVCESYEPRRNPTRAAALDSKWKTKRITKTSVAEVMLTCSVKYLYGVGVVCGHKLCQKITKQRLGGKRGHADCGQRTADCGHANKEF